MCMVENNPAMGLFGYVLYICSIKFMYRKLSDTSISVTERVGGGFGVDERVASDNNQIYFC